MAQEKGAGALAQYGPVAAPVVGVVLAVVFIAAVVATSGISQGQDDLQKTMKTVRTKLDSSEAAGDAAKIPLPDSVTASMEVGAKNGWTAPAGEKKLLGLPIHWKVTMDPKPQDEFAQYDENNDGYWDQPEFVRTPPFTGPAPRNDFNNWDRNKDGLISKDEYDDPPTDPREAFDALDKNKDGSLTSGGGEITTQEEYDWDRAPFDGKISFDEYVRRYEPHAERDLGPVQNVAAKIDPATMEIVVTWDDPDLKAVPEDLSFIVERRAPETVAKRQSEYRIKVADYTRKLREWESRFDKWWNNTVAEGEKTNKQLFPRKNEAEKKFGETDAKPLPPEEVDEWEEVVGPIAGNEYRDTSFDTDVTYTYAVRMATQKDPNRGQKFTTKTRHEGWYLFTDRTVTAGHPVIVSNRIAMAFAGSGQDTGNIELMKWHSIADSSTGTVTWYRVQITERNVAGGQDVGGEYTKAQMKDRGWKMFDIAGTEVNPEELLASDAKIDFSTGYTFVTKVGSDFLLNAREGKVNLRAAGDFVVPKDTNKEMVPSDPPSTDNALEIRCVGLKTRGSEATFELTRWHQVGTEWLRLVMTVSVKAGGDVGSEVTLGSTGSNVKVFDATGNPAASDVIKANKDEKIDMSAGAYGKLDGRTVDVGGSSFDLFGVLYKD